LACPRETPTPCSNLIQHGYTQLTTHQPASRFWLFQWIEGGWLLALSLLLMAATVWLVRRRAPEAPETAARTGQQPPRQ
jgi:hypothetical protein